MAEQLGTLLWELRTGRGWSQGQLAQRAGISKAALSRWESGARQPRVPELQAVLEALETTPAQRALAFAFIKAPRALRYLQASPESDSLGPPPAAGDLLRAMRQRRGWTQAQVAQRLGVGQNTVARWEAGERLPANEEMQALCFALEAHEEEFVALTTGGFTNRPQAIPDEKEEVEDYAHHLLYDTTSLADLRFLTLERALWQRAAQDAHVLPLLAKTYAFHAHKLGNLARWTEAQTLAERALALTPVQEPVPEFAFRATLKLAAASVYSSKQPAPERGIRLLKRWLPRSTQPDMTSWILSDMAKYLSLAGQTERGVTMSKQAIDVADAETTMREIDHGARLVEDLRPGEALAKLPRLGEYARGMYVYEMFVRTEAYLQMGELDNAHDYLQRAYEVIEARQSDHQRPQADALAKRL